jgi:hypothetical protein
MHLGGLFVQAVLYALLVAFGGISALGEQEPQYDVSYTCGRECDEQKNAEYDAHCTRASSEVLGKACAYTCYYFVS